MSVAIGGVRCRANFYRTARGVAAAIRLLAPTIKDQALSRLCMSFPSDIQGSVRAQLADVLVGVSCQRLEFLSEHRLRVPRCEILLPSSGAKGTIRAANFSQFANVLQAGGHDGMWTYDRYQRWIEQVSGWVRPCAPADEVIDVPAEDLDLAQLAELAKKVVERKP
jgi:Tfp pilus assembly pilus retraction ATPase PilT